MRSVSLVLAALAAMAPLAASAPLQEADAPEDLSPRRWWPKPKPRPKPTPTPTSHIPTLSPTSFVTTDYYCTWNMAGGCYNKAPWWPSMEEYEVWWNYFMDNRVIHPDEQAWFGLIMSIWTSEDARYSTDMASYASYTSSFYASYWSSYSSAHPGMKRSFIIPTPVKTIPDIPPTMLPVRNLLLRQEEPAASPAASAGSSSPTPSPVVSETPPAAQPSSNATEAAEPPAVSVSSTNATVATTHRKRRIAVVGAGASGSGAAFFLARAARVVEAQLGLAPGSLLEIVVYEKNDYIGGRAVTVTEPFMGEKLELGAAMMVNANINLRKVAAKFHLPLIAAPGGTAARMDMWDGKKVVYSNTGVAWWDKLTSGIRYGFLSPLRQASAVTKFVERMAQVYSPSFLAQRGTVNSIEQFVASLQLGSEYTSRSAFEWATKVVGVSARWANEMMDSMTRSNFGADVTQVHGIAALAGASVSEGALFMYGGNNQMFQAMLADSGADVRLSTAVTDITAAPGGGYIVSSANAPSNTTYDEVFWGNPWHLSPVAKGLQFTTPIPPQEYVRLHVTYVGTTATTPPPKYFKQGSKVVMAQSISTTGERARGGGDAPAFQVLLYHLAYPMSSIVLLFSHETLSDTEIRDIFGDTITWTHRKEWDGAYPLMKPTTVYPPVQPRAGFHYLAAMEPWLSTMETQTISAREAVARAVDAWWGLGVAQCDAGSSWDLACEPAPPPAMTLEELFNSMAGQ